jgi:hypothetical protein
LFIGLPYPLESKINQLTRYLAVPNSLNLQGFISNNNFKVLKDNKNLNKESVINYSKFLLPKLTKTPDLVILFDHEKSKNILSEAWVGKVPVIIFDSNIDSQDTFLHNFYVVKGNFKNILTTFDKNLFLVSLNFLFRKKQS